MSEAMNGPGIAGTSPGEELPESSGSRVAFFGGSFDPPHLGHLAVARAARAALALDTVLFAPVGMQPLKPAGPSASFEDRVAMTRLAIAGEAGFEVSLADAPKSSDAPGAAGHTPAPNYTIDTLKKLRASLAPGSALFCLMGADSFFGLRHWHRAAEIPFVAPLIVASRPGQLLEDLSDALPQGLTLESASAGRGIETGVEAQTFFLANPGGDRVAFYVLPGLDVDISASEIRAQIHTTPGSARAGRNLVPEPVRAYIAEQNLYRS